MRPILLDALEELFPKETWVVHHKDEDRSNNNIFNLEMMTDSNHKRLHSNGNKYGIGNKSRLKQTGSKPYATYINRNMNPYKRVWQSSLKYKNKRISLGVFEDFISCEIVAKIVMGEIR